MGAGNKVFVSTNNKGTSFNVPATWLASFAEPSGIPWDSARHLRMVSDVSGDGRADLVAFSEKDVLVAASAGKAFGSARKWAPGYGHSQD
jgi:hypothetical protein